MRARSTVIKEQLVELSEHRKIFYASYPPDRRPWTAKLTSTLPLSTVPVIHQLFAPSKKLADRSPPLAVTPDGPFSGRSSVLHPMEVEHAPELDPDDYLHAKKKLKDAILEHYR
jgi:hypothetical protein